METTVKYEPGVLVEDITKLTNEEWLNKRRNGIGGSDCSIIFGASPWRTARELYWDKIGEKDVVQEEENWVAKEVGHRLEELVAQIFFKRTGLQPYTVRKMFFHPKYPWMLADIDALVEMPNGKIYIVEIKTCSVNALDAWGEKNSNVIPYHYELQGRHYMSVVNADGVIFCLLAGNTEDGFRMRVIERDFDIERDIIEEEENFWKNHVLARKEPQYTEDAEMVLTAIRKHYGNANGGSVILSTEMSDPILNYAEVYAEKAEMEKKLREIKKRLADISIPIAQELSGANGTIDIGDRHFKTGYTIRTTHSIPADDLQKLKLLHPDVYDEFVKKSVSQSFYCKEVTGKKK